MDVAENRDGPPRNREKRCRADDVHLAFAADNEVAKGQPHLRNPELRGRPGATASSVEEGVDAAIAAWVAGDVAWNVLGQKLAEDAGMLHGNLVCVMKNRDLGA